MKTKVLLLLAAFTLVFTSCSEDDSVPNNELAGENGFEFERIAYSTDFVFVDDNNHILLSNQNITANSETVGNFVVFATKDGELRESTYTVGNKLESCTAIIAGTASGMQVQGADLLGDENTDDGFMRIVDYNSFENRLNIIFEFTRKDGKLVSGSYNGNFQRL